MVDKRARIRLVPRCGATPIYINLEQVAAAMERTDGHFCVILQCGVKLLMDGSAGKFFAASFNQWAGFGPDLPAEATGGGR